VRIVMVAKEVDVCDAFGSWIFGDDGEEDW
jgi:hypothetical protein